MLGMHSGRQAAQKQVNMECAIVQSLHERSRQLTSQGKTTCDGADSCNRIQAQTAQASPDVYIWPLARSTSKLSGQNGSSRVHWKGLRSPATMPQLTTEGATAGTALFCGAYLPRALAPNAVQEAGWI